MEPLNTCQQGCLIHLVTQTGQGVQISIHQPSPFMVQNLERVIPDWNLPVLWVVVFLQQARYELVESTSHVEREKERLREKFMRFGLDVAFELRDRGLLTDLIDPRTGYPLLSRIGEIPHDDTATVKALLDFPVIHNNCRVLEHPIWGMAVYPSILMSSASPKTIKSVLKKVTAQHDWKQPKTDLQLSISGV
ncbi:MULTISPECIES: methylmalonic aciduria and homocystinuria type D protein [Cyanophyceae]|uniref:methylmalonic aciduria and homocystinuria type D protein n=1 Tax=Cyanophyceae TaxID=3028117 RepID=UPI0024110844|nr:methylmalonic aciduria and homocystinuria type D protein [Trichocoleus sp. FACHB-40]